MKSSILTEDELSGVGFCHKNEAERLCCPIVAFQPVLGKINYLFLVIIVYENKECKYSV